MPRKLGRGVLPILILLVAGCLVGADLARAEDEEVFDPLEGMDEDGRIPAAVRPEGMKHPDRWRYIPEGRIKPGNIFQRFLVSSFAAPFFFRDGDVGVGGGIAITDIDFRQQRRREFGGTFLSYSEKVSRATPSNGVVGSTSSRFPRGVSYRKSAAFSVRVGATARH